MYVTAKFNYNIFWGFKTMNNNLIKDTTRTISSVISPEIIEKCGWLTLLTPVVFYTVDKLSDLVLTAMDKDYSLTINTDAIQISLNKPNTLTE